MSDLQHLLIQSVTDYAIYAFDADGFITSWNPGAQALKGYLASEIIGQHFSIFYTAADRADGRPARLLEHAAAHGHVEDEGWRVRKDGSKFWALVVISAIRDGSGKLAGFAKVTRDMTDRVRSEENHIRVAQLQEAARIRDQFLAYISHEMRTPLAAMQLQLELLRAETVAQTLADLPRIVERLTRSYGRLSELVDSILTQSRIQAGFAILQRKSVDLGNLVAELADELRPEAERKGLRLVVAPCERTVLHTDGNFVRVILRNLVGNAIKFTKHGKIGVSIVRDAAFCRIQVEDEGPGIADENYQRIFEPFERIEPVANKHSPGFGLGLATSRKLSEALGGELALRSQLGVGSVFSLVLPLRTVMAG